MNHNKKKLKKKNKKRLTFNTVCSGYETFSVHLASLFVRYSQDFSPLGCLLCPKKQQRKRLFSLCLCVFCYMVSSSLSHQSFWNFPYLESCIHASLFLGDIYFLGYNLMGNPFWGRAKGSYWIPFCAPTTDHLHNK